MAEKKNQVDPDGTLAAEFVGIISEMSRRQRDWQDAIGFGEEGNTLRAINHDIHYIGDTMPLSTGVTEQLEKADAALRNYYIAKLALITTEVAEAIEEIRHNHAIDENYYVSPAGQVVHDAEGYTNILGHIPKPEGVPSELADIVIRCLSLAGETGIDLGSAIIEKLNYNATRAQRHGGKAI